MCRRVSCSRCGKPTFAGCGRHIEQVLGNVPKDQRCHCREESAPSSGGASVRGGALSWLAGLLGRK